MASCGLVRWPTHGQGASRELISSCRSAGVVSKQHHGPHHCCGRRRSNAEFESLCSRFVEHASTCTTQPLRSMVSASSMRKRRRGALREAPGSDSVRVPRAAHSSPVKLSIAYGRVVPCTCVRLIFYRHLAPPQHNKYGTRAGGPSNEQCGRRHVCVRCEAPLSAVDRTSIQAVMTLDEATWRTFDARKKRTSKSGQMAEANQAADARPRRLLAHSTTAVTRRRVGWRGGGRRWSGRQRQARRCTGRSLMSRRGSAGRPQRQRGGDGGASPGTTRLTPRHAAPHSAVMA